MKQVARPIADVLNEGWSPPPLFTHLDSWTPNDGDPIACLVPPGGLFEVQLAKLARPITGHHRLRVRLQNTLPCFSLVTFFLLQGTQIIAARSVLPTQGFADYDLVLTEQEVDLITDYTNLSLRVLAGGPGSGSCSASGSTTPGSISGSGSLSGSGSQSGPCEPPTILDIEPNPVIIGDPVTITGTNLTGTGSVSV